MKTFLTLLLALGLTLPVFAQTETQTIKGTVIDQQTQQPLQGATVRIKNSDPVRGAYTNETGDFRIPDVPVGRYTLIVAFVGYETQEISNLLLNSVKELSVEVALEQKMLDALVIEFKKENS